MRKASQTRNRGQGQRRGYTRRSPGSALLGFILLGGLGALLLALPLLVLLWRGVARNRWLPGGTLCHRCGPLSLVTSGISLLFTLLLGTPLAYVWRAGRFATSRGGDHHRPPDRPAAMVAGIGLLLAFGRTACWAARCTSLAFTCLHNRGGHLCADVRFRSLYIRAARLGSEPCGRT